MYQPNRYLTLLRLQACLQINQMPLFNDFENQSTNGDSMNGHDVNGNGDTSQQPRRRKVIPQQTGEKNPVMILNEMRPGLK